MYKAKYLQQRPSSSGLVLDIPLTHFVAGTTVYDETGGGFNGTATNSPTPQYPGFDFVAASSMYIDIGTGPTSVKTVSLWLKQDDITANEYPIDLNAGTDGLSVITGVLTVFGFGGHILYVNGAVGTSGVTTIEALKWYHTIITCATAKNASNLDIARVAEVTYFDGVIGDVRLYNRVLSPAEVLGLYNLQRSRYSI